jgi:2-oxoglutarate ferredoxin oxidoreductase subunit alpha
LPDIDALPDISVPFATEKNHVNDEGLEEFWPYLRDPETLARPWAIPGTPGLMHRIGGIEKEDGSGNISYAPDNHQRMVELRAAKVAGIARDIPPTEIAGDATDADLLVVSWGSTWASVDSAIERRRREGRKLAWVHLTHLNPLPSDLGDIVQRYPKVLVPELNSGQLVRILRANFLIDARSATKIKGLPFTARELEDAIEQELAR